MGITISTWSGTYVTQIVIGLDQATAPKVTYQEYAPPVTGSEHCIVKHVSGSVHQTEIEVTGPDPESIRDFLLEMLAALPEPLIFTDDAVLDPMIGDNLTPVAG